MKNTGIIRRVDRLGRIVLPMSIRKHFDIKIDDPVEIFTEDEQIVLRKYEPACIFCGDAEDIVTWRGKRICHKCLTDMKTEL